MAQVREERLEKQRQEKRVEREGDRTQEAALWKEQMTVIREWAQSWRRATEERRARVLSEKATREQEIQDVLRKYTATSREEQQRSETKGRDHGRDFY